MSLTDHDEFLHLGFPKNTKTKWKENYYFNFFDKDSNAMGIFHFSHQRWDGKAKLTSAQCIDGKHHFFREFIDLPLTDPDLHNGDFVVKNEHFGFRVVDPYKHHVVTFEKDNLSIHLNFRDRFPVVDFEAKVKSETDKSLDIDHYEQGMHVEGLITLNGTEKSIKCYGHRDHTWGVRNEAGLKGWHWLAILGERSSWNLTRVNRVNAKDDQTGFYCHADGTNFVTGLEVLDIQYNEKKEPVLCRYKGTLDNGEIRTIVAKRLHRLDLKTDDLPVGYFENMSEFVIEETGETGVGVDEHMVLNV